MNLVHEASEPGASRATSDQPGECAGASGTGRYGLTWIVNAVVVPVPLEVTTDVGPYHGNRVPQTLLERDSATVCSDIRQGAIDVTEVTRGECVGALDTGELGAVERAIDRTRDALASSEWFMGTAVLSQPQLSTLQAFGQTPKMGGN